MFSDSTEPGYFLEFAVFFISPKCVLFKRNVRSNFINISGADVTGCSGVRVGMRHIQVGCFPSLGGGGGEFLDLKRVER